MRCRCLAVVFPTAVSRPVPFAGSNACPIDLWLAQGALVLEPNYRGSAGSGEKFCMLNIRNLGVGDSKSRRAS